MPCTCALILLVNPHVEVELAIAGREVPHYYCVRWPPVPSSNSCDNGYAASAGFSVSCLLPRPLHAFIPACLRGYLASHAWGGYALLVAF